MESFTVPVTVFKYSDMPAHRRDTTRETTEQNHRKEAYLKAH